MSVRSFVIAVPERRENANYMIEHMELPNASVVEAVLTTALDYPSLEKAGEKHPHFDLPLAKYAVNLSHKKALNACLASGAARCLIFEDDIDADEAGTRWKDVEVPPDADIFFYGRCWDEQQSAEPAGPGVVRTYRPLCRHALNVSRRAAEILAGIQIVDVPCDYTVASLCRGALRCYASSPPVVDQSRFCTFCLNRKKQKRRFRSLIQTGTPNHFDFGLNLPEFSPFLIYRSLWLPVLVVAGVLVALFAIHYRTLDIKQL